MRVDEVLVVNECESFQEHDWENCCENSPEDSALIKQVRYWNSIPVQGHLLNDISDPTFGSVLKDPGAFGRRSL